MRSETGTENPLNDKKKNEKRPTDKNPLEEKHEGKKKKIKEIKFNDQNKLIRMHVK